MELKMKHELPIGIFVGMIFATVLMWAVRPVNAGPSDPNDAHAIRTSLESIKSSFEDIAKSQRKIAEGCKK
jgi:hypothetical protein